tara:strand:- start:219503 stop:219964 length:462 start_codon:yes stop_codon:yes gene_type:complete
MNILDYQYFVDAHHQNKTSDDGGGSASFENRSTSKNEGFYTLPQENQVGILLTDDFGKFATRLMNGETVITHSDGRVEHKSSGERITQLIPSTALRGSGNETILHTGFNTHSIRTPDGITIEILENGEINISEADGKNVKARANNTINSHYIK